MLCNATEKRTNKKGEKYVCSLFSILILITFHIASFALILQHIIFYFYDHCVFADLTFVALDSN